MTREREKRDKIYCLNEKKRRCSCISYFKNFTFQTRVLISHAHTHTHTHALEKMPVDKQPAKKDKLTDAEKKKLKQANKVKARILFRGGRERLFFGFAC